MSDSERAAAILLERAEQHIMFHLGGPVAEQVWRARVAGERPDADGWKPWHDPRENVAFHEAGHAIVMYLLGTRPPAVAALVQTAETYGGFVSEAPEPPPAWPGRSDRQQIIERLKVFALVGPGDWRTLRGVVRRLSDQTRALVVANWTTVSAVAARLLDRGELDGAELAGIIEATGPRRQT